MTLTAFCIFGFGVGAIVSAIADDREPSLWAVVIATLGAILFVSSFGE